MSSYANQNSKQIAINSIVSPGKFKDLPRQPVSNPMTPDAFARIKNSLFNEYSLLDYGRFADIISTSYANIWREMGEKAPVKEGANLSNRDKTALVFERLEIEPSPKRFIELCDAVARHLHYVSTLPATKEATPDVYRQDIAGIFLADIREAFDKYGFGHTLIIDTYEEHELTKHSVKYAGVDFCVHESQSITQQGFKSVLFESRHQVKAGLEKNKYKSYLLIKKFVGNSLRQIIIGIVVTVVSTALIYLLWGQA